MSLNSSTGSFRRPSQVTEAKYSCATGLFSSTSTQRARLALHHDRQDLRRTSARPRRACRRTAPRRPSCGRPRAPGSSAPPGRRSRPRRCAPRPRCSRRGPCRAAGRASGTGPSTRTRRSAWGPRTARAAPARPRTLCAFRGAAGNKVSCRVPALEGPMSSVPAYSITADAIAAEKERVGGDLAKFDIANVRHARHARAAAARRRRTCTCASSPSPPSTTSTTPRPRTPSTSPDRRGGKIYPGNSAIGEVLAVGALVTKFKPGDIVITHCNGGPDEYGFPTRIWAYDADDSIGWYAKEAVVGDWQIIQRAARLRPQPVGDRGDAAARADGVPPVAARARHLPAQGAPRAARAC